MFSDIVLTFAQSESPKFIVDHHGGVNKICLLWIWIGDIECRQTTFVLSSIRGLFGEVFYHGYSPFAPVMLVE
jgi:hypothetical protein